MKLTNEGIIKDNPIEIRKRLQDEVVNYIDGADLLPSSLLSNLLDESVIIENQIQDMITNTFNGISINSSNDFLIKMLGNAFGLVMREKTLPITTITFYGNAGTYINEGIEVSNEDGSKKFKTNETGIIKLNGEANITCVGLDYYDTPTAKNTLNVLVNQIIGINSCTNLNDVVESLEAETIREFRERFQIKARSNRTGTADTITTNLLKVNGVDKRLISFKTNQVRDTGSIRSVLEVVVGGGDDYDVANALFNSVLDPNILYSKPSGDESDRTISINVIYNSTPFLITYTRPKIKQMDLDVKLTVLSGYLTIPSEAYTIKQKPYFDDYINNLSVGVEPTGFTFDKLIYDCFSENGLNRDIITKIEYIIKVNELSVSLDSDRHLKTEYDEAYSLINFNVLIGNK